MTRAAAALAVSLLSAASACTDRAAEPAAGDRPVVVLAPVEPRTPTGSDIEYTLRFDDAAHHYVDVTAVFPTDGADTVELMLPVWTPGSYKVREYARHIEAVTASELGGSALRTDKVRKNRWRITTGGAPRVAVRYRVYARELTVRTNFVDRDIAVLNGAPTFLTLGTEGVRRHDILIEPAADWARTVTALPAHPDGKPHHYLAPDYDTLVDSPIVAGNPELHSLEAEGVDHLVAFFRGGSAWEGERAAADIDTLLDAQLGFWGVVPYRRYVILQVLQDIRKFNGLEHKESTLLTTWRWATRKRGAYLRWLALVSHELFHIWNGKRLRPVELGPFDYEAEVYSRSLWVVEGMTSYYDYLLLRRAGLMTHAEYLDKLSDHVEEIARVPGRAVQPLSQASHDAWIKYYLPDENSDNSSVSYYTKGALVGFLLDTELRRRTGGARSLDVAMRLAYDRYSGDRGFTPEQFRAVVEEVAGSSLADFWARYIDGTDELDYGPALAYYGLRFKQRPQAGKKDAEAAWLGASMSGTMVEKVLRETPAHEAGLNVGDELIAIDRYRVKNLPRRLARYRPGDRVTLLVARDGVMTELPATLDREPWPYRIEVASDDVGSTGRRRAWLGPDSAEGGEQ